LTRGRGGGRVGVDGCGKAFVVVLGEGILLASCPHDNGGWRARERERLK
jgi:hypothetical protein